MASTQLLPNDTKHTLIFTYGTLKRHFPNYPLIQALIEQNDAVYLGNRITNQCYPLVVGPKGIPYLINLPGCGHRVKGELYSLTARGLARVDELEGTSIGHYERCPVEVLAEHGGVVAAEAYFADGTYGERMWEKKGRVGLSDYSEEDAKFYVKKENRPKGRSFLEDIELFLSN